jgi:hypothetical protein
VPYPCPRRVRNPRIQARSGPMLASPYWARKARMIRLPGSHDWQTPRGPTGVSPHAPAGPARLVSARSALAAGGGAADRRPIRARCARRAVCSSRSWRRGLHDGVLLEPLEGPQSQCSSHIQQKAPNCLLGANTTRDVMGCLGARRPSGAEGASFRGLSLAARCRGGRVRPLLW